MTVSVWDDMADLDAAVWAAEGDGVDMCLADVEPWLPERGLVVDLGCGVGRLTLPLTRRHPGLVFVGVDSSERMLDEAWRRVLGAGSPFHFVKNDGRTLDVIAGQSVAAAFSVLMFQHVADDIMWGYLQEIGRVLIPGAPFRFQFVVGDGVDGPLSFRRRMPQVDLWCAQAGLVVTAVNGSAFSPDWQWCTAVKR